MANVAIKSENPTSFGCFFHEAISTQAIYKYKVQGTKNNVVNL